MLDPETLFKLRHVLVNSAGGYIRNTIREARVTCEVCTTPIEQRFTVCFQCNRRRERDLPLADRIGTLTYAWSGHQSGRLMEGYKGRNRNVTQDHVSTVTLLSLFALQVHGHCAEQLAGLAATHWTSVPSLPRREGDHALRALVRPFVPGQELRLVAAEAVRNPRELSPAHFTAVELLPSRSHVLIIDDTWTSGAHAQSAAVVVRAAGAAQVSVLILARWLKPDPQYPVTERFMRERLTRDYDPMTCPWTGAACP